VKVLKEALEHAIARRLGKPIRTDDLEAFGGFGVGETFRCGVEFAEDVFAGKGVRRGDAEGVGRGGGLGGSGG
jgi:hypothetical protein